MEEDLFSLHRYFIWSLRLKEVFEDALRRLGGFSQNQMNAFFVDDRGQFMSYWYAALYVVVEGYQELRLSDPEIDRLIRSPHVELLRRYRNGVFHYQKKYFDEQFSGFMGPPETVEWVRSLSSELGRYFHEQIDKRDI